MYTEDDIEDYEAEIDEDPQYCAECGRKTDTLEGVAGVCPMCFELSGYSA